MFRSNTIRTTAAAAGWKRSASQGRSSYLTLHTSNHTNSFRQFHPPQTLTATRLINIRYHRRMSHEVRRQLTTTPPPVAPEDVTTLGDRCKMEDVANVQAKLWCLPTADEWSLLTRTLGASPRLAHRELFKFESARSKLSSNEEVRRMFEVQSNSPTTSTGAPESTRTSAADQVRDYSEKSRSLLRVAYALMDLALQARQKNDSTTSVALTRLIQIRLQEVLALLARCGELLDKHHELLGKDGNIQFLFRTTLIRVLLVTNRYKTAMDVIQVTETGFPLMGFPKAAATVNKSEGVDPTTRKPIAVKLDTIHEFESDSFLNIPFQFEVHRSRAEYHQRQNQYAEAVVEWQAASQIHSLDPLIAAQTPWVDDAKLEVLVNIAHCEQQLVGCDPSNVWNRLQLGDQFIREKLRFMEETVADVKKSKISPIDAILQRYDYMVDSYNNYSRQFDTIRQRVRRDLSQAPFSSLGLEANLISTTIAPPLLETFTHDQDKRAILFQPLTPHERQLVRSLGLLVRSPNSLLEREGLNPYDRMSEMNQRLPTTLIQAHQTFYRVFATLMSCREFISQLTHSIAILNQRPDHKVSDVTCLTNLVQRRLFECQRLAQVAFENFYQFQAPTMDEAAVTAWKLMIRSLLLPLMIRLSISSGQFQLARNQLAQFQELLDQRMNINQPAIITPHDLNLIPTIWVELSAEYHQFQGHYAEATKYWSKQLELIVSLKILPFHSLIHPSVQLTYCLVKAHDLTQARLSFTDGGEIASKLVTSLETDLQHHGRERDKGLSDTALSPQAKFDLTKRWNELLMAVSTRSHRAQYQWERLALNHEFQKTLAAATN